MRKKSPIHFIHGVIKVKEMHQSNLLPDHEPKPIASETHLAEVAKLYKIEGYLSGRKSKEGDTTSRSPCTPTMRAYN